MSNRYDLITHDRQLVKRITNLAREKYINDQNNLNEFFFY